jgi:hypothetical protein
MIPTSPIAGTNTANVNQAAQDSLKRPVRGRAGREKSMTGEGSYEQYGTLMPVYSEGRDEKVAVCYLLSALS